MVARRERRRDDDKLARGVGGRLGDGLAGVAQLDFPVRRRAAGDDRFARRIDVHHVEGGLERPRFGLGALSPGAGRSPAARLGQRAAGGTVGGLGSTAGALATTRKIGRIRLKEFRIGPNHGARSGGHDRQSGCSDPNQRVPRRHACSLSPLTYNAERPLRQISNTDAAIDCRRIRLRIPVRTARLAFPPARSRRRRAPERPARARRLRQRVEREVGALAAQPKIAKRAFGDSRRQFEAIDQLSRGDHTIAGLTAKLLDARRGIDGVAEKNDLPLHRAHLAGHHRTAMEPGSHRDGHAEFASVVGRASGQLVDGGETGRDAARRQRSPP